MKFILDERAYVEDLIKNKTIGKSEKISIRLLLKYYRECGMDKEQAIGALVAFMEEVVPNFKEYCWKTTINNLAELVYTGEQDLIVVESIPITYRELDYILSVDDFRQQCVLFSLLVYKKIQNLMNKQSNEWFSGSLSDIFKMARVTGVHGLVENQCRMVHQFKEAGLIDLAKRITNLHLRLNYIDLEIKDESQIALVIDDFRDVIYVFYKLSGKRVVKCQVCGSMIKLKKNERTSRKYCNKCKQIVANDKVARFRERQK